MISKYFYKKLKKQADQIKEHLLDKHGVVAKVHLKLTVSEYPFVEFEVFNLTEDQSGELLPYMTKLSCGFLDKDLNLCMCPIQKIDEIIERKKYVLHFKKQIIGAEIRGMNGLLV